MIDLFKTTGKLSWEDEQNIELLRHHLELAHAKVGELNAKLAALPPILTLAQIQEALSPTGSHPLPTASLLNTLPAQSNPVPPTPNPPPSSVPNHLAEVQAQMALTPVGPTSTNAELFRFAQNVAWNIMNLGTDPPGLNVGLLMQAAGDGTYTCAGITYASFRICYDNGANIKILTGSFTPQWTQETDIPLSDYHVPTDPASPC